MTFDFRDITGPKDSKQANFEFVVGQLLTSLFGATTLDGRGGDNGIDAFVGDLDRSPQTYQAKYFLNTLTKSQRAQIAESLKRATNYCKPASWTLVTPKDPTPADYAWFTGLKSGVALEWWGDTQLASLLAQRPGIADIAFTNSVTAQMRRFEHALTDIRRVLTDHPDRYKLQSLADTMTPERYLDGLLLRQRDMLADTHADWTGPDAYLLLDMSELYSYMQTDIARAIHTPLIDFCVTRTRWRLAITPPTVGELHYLVQNVTRHGDPRLWEQLGPLVTTFMRAVEKNPSSSQARVAFEHLKEATRQAGWHLADLRRLSALVTSGQLTTFPSSKSSRESVLRPSPTHERIVQCISKSTRRLPMSAHRDAMNLGILRNSAANNIPVRMMSSDRHLPYVWDEVFPNEQCPIRDSRDVGRAILLQERLVAGESQELLQSGLAAAKFIRHHVAELNDPASVSQLHQLREPMRYFDNLFVQVLHPTDRMLITGVSVLDEEYKIEMKSLYVALCEYADLAKSFKQWWDERVALMEQSAKTIRTSTEQGLS